MVCRGQQETGEGQRGMTPARKERHGGEWKSMILGYPGLFFNHLLKASEEGLSDTVLETWLRTSGRTMCSLFQ